MPAWRRRQSSVMLWWSASSPSAPVGGSTEARWGKKRSVCVCKCALFQGAGMGDLRFLKNVKGHFGECALVCEWRRSQERMKEKGSKATSGSYRESGKREEESDTFQEGKRKKGEEEREKDSSVPSWRRREFWAGVSCRQLPPFTPLISTVTWHTALSTQRDRNTQTDRQTEPRRTGTPLQSGVWLTTCISNCRGYTESIPGLCGFSNKGISSLKCSIFHGWWFFACAPSKLSRNTALNSTKTRDITDIFSHWKRREYTRSTLSIHSLLKHYETEKKHISYSNFKTSAATIIWIIVLPLILFMKYQKT